MEYGTIIEIIKLKDSRVSEFSDDVIQMAVQEIEQVIKNYCVIPEIPEALKYVWANMALDYLIYQHESTTTPNNPQDAFDASDVTNIKLGDTSVTVGDKSTGNRRSTILKSHSYNLDSITLNYRSQLNRFRRIY